MCFTELTRSVLASIPRTMWNGPNRKRNLRLALLDLPTRRGFSLLLCSQSPQSSSSVRLRSIEESYYVKGFNLALVSYVLPENLIVLIIIHTLGVYWNILTGSSICKRFVYGKKTLESKQKNAKQSKNVRANDAKKKDHNAKGTGSTNR